MTTKLALLVALLLALGMAADAMLNDWQATIWLGRQFLEWLNWLAIWRRL